MTPVIQLDHISKQFQRRYRRGEYNTLKSALMNVFRSSAQKKANQFPVVALNDINFKVASGQFVGIIGKNGSGKSTLLKILAGVLQPDSGTVTVQGRISALLELGAGFHPDFTGRENIYLNGAVLGLSRQEIKTKFDEIVEFSELQEFIDSPVRTYSSGMYMRLAFSIATHVDADILLIDEILAVGDGAFVKKCESRLEQFKKANKTIILVTHDMGTVEKWCDEVILLSEGRLKSKGNAQKTVVGYLEDLGLLMKEEIDGEVTTGLAQKINLTSVPSDRCLTLYWNPPPVRDYMAVKIVRRTDRFPMHHEDGTPVYWYNGTSFTDGGLVNGQDYYYALFVHDKNYRFSPGINVMSTPVEVKEAVVTPATAAPVPTVDKPTRWGNREIQIERLKLTDRQGKEKSTFNIKENITLEINYRITHRPKTVPVFGIGLFREDGVCVYGTNTDLDNASFTVLPDAGTIRFTFKDNCLLHGNYWLDVAVHDPHHLPYDYWTKAIHFNIHAANPEPGVFVPEHEWALK